ncbi:MAG: ribbon-helix-helix protein, CopG family [Thermoanaerobaculia bacterium]
MRTTVRLPDEVLEEAKQYALEHDQSLTELFEEALREHLARRKQLGKQKRRVVLPTFSGGGVLPGVDLHDSAGLLDIMEGISRPGERDE